MMKLFIFSALLFTSACTDSKKLSMQCERFFAETGDAKYHAKTDCRSDVAAERGQVHALEAEKKKEVVAARVEKKVLTQTRTPLPKDERPDFITAFRPWICRDLKQSNATVSMVLTILTYSDHEPLYSLHEVYPAGSADMQSTLYTAGGKGFCVDGGISGGDCSNHLSSRTSTGVIKKIGTAQDLSDFAKCS